MSDLVTDAVRVWLIPVAIFVSFSSKVPSIKYELLRAILWPIFLLCIPVAYAIYCVRWLVRWMEAV